MKDRNVQYPTRFHVKPVPGTDDICEIIPAPGEVYENGTFWNKANVLKDVTAALYGLTADAVPDEVFAMIRPLIAAAQSTASGKASLAKGEYVGTFYGRSDGSTNTDKAVTLTLGFKPYGGIIIPKNYDQSDDYGLWCVADDMLAWHNYGFTSKCTLRSNGIILPGKYVSSWGYATPTESGVTYKYVFFG